VEQALGISEPGAELPRMEGYAVRRTAAADALDEDQTQTFGFFLDWSHPDRARSDRWSMVYEGALPGSGRASGDVAAPAAESEYALFRDRAASFCEVGVCGMSDCPSTVDHLVILDDPSPLPGSEVDCSPWRAPADGSEWPGLEYRIRMATDTVLQIEPLPERRGAPPLPDPECFPYAVAYEVRAAGYWVLVGDEVGLLHRRQAGEWLDLDGDGELDGRACEDEPVEQPCGQVTCDTASYEPGADPLQRTALEGSPSCLLTGRVPRAGVFANPFFCFNLLAPECGGLADDECLPRDTSFVWDVRGGFSEASVEVGDLPGSMRWNPGNGSVYVLDQSSLGLVQVDFDSLSVVQSYP
jgi:hypothetical protein